MAASQWRRKGTEEDEHREDDVLQVPGHGALLQRTDPGGDVAHGSSGRTRPSSTGSREWVPATPGARLTSGSFT